MTTDFSRELWKEVNHMLMDFKIENGEPRCYRGSKNYWTYIEASNNRRMFCWSTRPDTNGDYWSWDYIRKGPAKKATWVASKWIRCAKRTTAKRKAERRCQRYHHQEVTA